GMDIDPLMIELSAFSIYLKTRTICEEPIELPVPNLYYWGTTAGADAIGSLRLGNEIGDAKLFRIDGEKNVVLNIGEPTTPTPSSFHGIATNPPYLSHRMMPDEVSNYLKEHYSSAQYDLYAAFISLGSKLLHSDGTMAMICQQSFLSIQRYEKLR